MIILLIAPLFFAVLGTLTVVITLIVNSYIFPNIGLGDYEINLATGFFLALFFILTYFMFFTKKIEGDKFKAFLEKDIHFGPRK